MKTKKLLRVAFALMLAFAMASQAFASNILTNVMGYNEYLAANGGRPMTTNEVYAIEATVVVCKNPDGKFDREKSLPSQGEVVGTVAYWPSEDIRSALQRGEIISTDIPLYDRRLLSQNIPSSALKFVYSWDASRDRLNIGIPNPGISGVEAFKSWTETPENCNKVINHALCAKNNSSADESTLEMWTELAKHCEPYYTEIPKMEVADFVPTVEDGKLVSKVEFSVVWSVKILYEKDDVNGNKERYFVDTNQIAQIDREFTMDGGSAAEQYMWYATSKVAYGTMEGYLNDILDSMNPALSDLGLKDNLSYQMLERISSGDSTTNIAEVNRIQKENADKVLAIIKGSASGDDKQHNIETCLNDCAELRAYWEGLIHEPETIISPTNKPMFKGAAGTYAYVTHPKMSVLEENLFANSSGVDYSGGYSAMNFITFEITERDAAKIPQIRI